MEHIEIDHTKDFPFDFVEYLSFFIHGNTIFFIENYLWGGSDRKPKLVAIDFAKKTCHILPFAPPVNKYEIYFHLSGDASYLLIHMQGLERYRYDRVEWSSTYAIDLTQGDRVFVLNPPMKWSIDAFLKDGKFYFLGKRSSDDYSIYQYDVKSNALTDFFSKENHNVWTALTNLMRSSSRLTVEWMEERNGKYYFLLTHNPYREEKTNKYYLRVVDPKDWSGEEPFPFPSYSIFFYGNSIFCTEFGKLYDLNTGTLTDCHVSGKGLILLGDFLCGGKSKTNVSNGWDNLQWEIMTIPE